MEEELKAAAAWWITIIRGPAQTQNAGMRTPEEIMLSFAATSLNTDAKQQHPITDEQATTFEQAFIDTFQEHFSGRSGLKVISVEYSPDKVFESVFAAAGINPNVAPIKTVMWVDPGLVTVRNGYGAPIIVVYWDRQYLFGYRGNNFITDMSSRKWFRDILVSEGCRILHEEPVNVGTFYGGPGAEVIYEAPDKSYRRAYIFSGQADVDSFYEDVYVFNEPVPHDILADVIEVIRERGK